MQEKLRPTFYAQSATGTWAYREWCWVDRVTLVAAKPVRADTCLIQSCGIDTSETWYWYALVCCDLQCLGRPPVLHNEWVVGHFNLVICSVVSVNQTETETAVFCYLQESSMPRCFRPKMAQFLWIFIFSVYIISTVFTFSWHCH